MASSVLVITQLLIIIFLLVIWPQKVERILVKTSHLLYFYKVNYFNITSDIVVIKIKIDTDVPIISN